MTATDARTQLLRLTGEPVKLVRAAAERLDHLTRDLLDLARLEAESVHIIREVVADEDRQHPGLSGHPAGIGWGAAPKRSRAAPRAKTWRPSCVRIPCTACLRTASPLA